MEIVDDDEAGTDTPAAQEFREARKDNKTWARLIESRLFLVKWSIFCAKINSLGFLFPLSELLFNWGGSNVEITPSTYFFSWQNDDDGYRCFVWVAECGWCFKLVLKNVFFFFVFECQ